MVSRPTIIFVAPAPVDPVAPVEPVNAIAKLKVFSIVMSEPICTGIVTVPAEVTDVSTAIVSVGAVLSLSDVTVTPVGAVTSDSVTEAAT
jgi:hypothetical protein